MENKEEIFKRLKHDLKADDEIAVTLYEGLYGALSYYKNSIGLYIPSKTFSEIKTDKGHDSFLLNEPEFLKTLKGFIDSMHIKFKNEKRI